jgi:hypothetical protein
MINARMMYLRPGNLFKEFVLEKKTETKVTEGGRVITGKFDSVNPTIIQGCLAQATDKDIANHSIENHVVSHTIVQSGPRQAERHDRLVLNNRVFYVTDVDDADDLGVSTIYYAEERHDVK